LYRMFLYACYDQTIAPHKPKQNNARKQAGAYGKKRYKQDSTVS
jgi:hypothetical protein